jgi:hypothetical protein
VRRYRRPAAAIAFTLGLAGVAVGASGCSFTSEKIISTPYAASDGSNVDIPLAGSGVVKLSNVLVVSEAKDKPGVLVGAVSTTGTEPVPLQVTVVDPSGQSALGQTTVTATPGTLVQIGPSSPTKLQVQSVPVPPGSVLTVHVQGAAGGREFTVPVLAPENQYASLSPAAAPTSESASESASPSASESASESPSPSGSASASRRSSPSASRASSTASPTP